jgi:acetolactate synthase-1/2/3 large subunit
VLTELHRVLPRDAILVAEHARVAAEYDVKTWKVEDPDALGGVLRQAAEYAGPALVDVIAQPLEEAAAPVL